MRIIMTSSAKMPHGASRFNGRGGRYVNIAVVEVEDDFYGRPKMISKRAKGVKDIIAFWGGVWLGSTNRSEGGKIFEEAKSLL